MCNLGGNLVCLSGYWSATTSTFGGLKKEKRFTHSVYFRAEEVLETAKNTPKNYFFDVHSAC